MAQQAYAPFLRRVLAVAPALRHVVWLGEAAVLALFWGLLRLLPLDTASALGGRLLGAIGPRLAKHRHVRRNLEIAFPARPAAEIEELARGVWRTLGRMLAELPLLARIWREAEQRVEIVAKGEARAPGAPPRPAILVTGHFANWETTVPAAVSLGHPVVALYAPDANPWIGRMILRARGALGIELIPRDGGVRSLVRALRDGRSVGLIVDTRIDEGEWVPFFGVPALTTTVPARLALRFGCDLIPVQVERTDGARFRITFHEPIPPAAEGDDAARARAMTERLHACFETWIRQHPEQWMCTKRRWPKEASPASRC